MPSSNISVFAELYAHHKNLLTHFGGTDGPDKLFCNFFL